MTLTNTIQAIIMIPIDFYKYGNVSVVSLLKKSGYFDSYNQITPGNIIPFLLENPAPVKDWIAYSEDKRSSEGWFFKKEAENIYTVGFFSLNETEKVIEKYTDPITACATFIKNEAESIRVNALRNP